jgi:AraC-like DNA-binding protein
MFLRLQKYGKRMTQQTFCTSFSPLQKIIRNLAKVMYSLKEGWKLMHGDNTVNHWDGMMLCNETDAAITFRANNIQGFLDLQNAQEQAIDNHPVPQRVEELFIDFIRLLPDHFAQHHDIGFYASRLNISKVYLSRIVRQVTGRTVVGYINQMLLMEASFQLRTSQLSISQIADRLHFADTPSFSKFFSRMKGMSPREYRELI